MFLSTFGFCTKFIRKFLNFCLNCKNSNLFLQTFFLISSDSEVNLDETIKFRPPNGFSDSREFSEAECDRDRALDLEVQQALGTKTNVKANAEEITSLLARYFILEVCTSQRIFFILIPLYQISLPFHYI